MRRYLLLCLAFTFAGCTATPSSAGPSPAPTRPESSGPTPGFSPPPEQDRPFGVLGPVVTAQTLGQRPGATAGPADLTFTLLPNGYLRLFFLDRMSGAVRS